MIGVLAGVGVVIVVGNVISRFSAAVGDVNISKNNASSPVHDFPEAHNPAYQLTIDFGDLGIKKSSAQITTLYKKQDLLNRQIVAVVNFQKKQIGNIE